MRIPNVSPPVIRTAVAADASVLADLGRRTFRDAFGADNREEDLETFLVTHYDETVQRQELADPNLTYFLAEDRGVPAAFALLRRGPPWPQITDPTSVELQRFYVDRPWQGSGVAQALMRHCVDVAQASGAGSLFLGVWERNARALRFYAAQGFVSVGQHEFVVGTDRQTDIVMVRRLVAPAEG